MFWTRILLLLALLQLGTCQDVSRIRFNFIQKHMPNYPDPRSGYVGTRIAGVTAMDCLKKCANQSSCDLFAFNSAAKSCYLSDKEVGMISSGLFRDASTSTFVMLKGSTLSDDFFFLDVAPVWPAYFEYQSVETAQLCSDICVRDTRPCVAISFFPTNNTCKTYNHSIIQDGTRTTVRRRDSNRDGMYFEKLFKNFDYFSAVTGYRIVGGSAIPSDSAKTCAEYCLTHAACVGFSQSFNRTCHLSTKMQLIDLISDRATQLALDPQSIYFEMWRTTGFESNVKYQIDGQITSPGFPIDYTAEHRFVKIISQPGMQLTAALTRLNLPLTESGQCVDDFAINNQTQCNIPADKLPVSLTPQVLGNGQQFIDVKLISQNGTKGNASSGKYYGFRIEYEMTWNCSGESNPIEIKAGNLDKVFNPGFPRVQRQSNDCAWKITTADPTKPVALFFGELPANMSLLSISKDGQPVASADLEDGLFGKSVEIKYLSSLAQPRDSFLIYYSEANYTGFSEYKQTKSISCDQICAVEPEASFLADIDKYHVVNLHFQVTTKDYERDTGMWITFSSLGFGHRDHFGICQGGWIDVFIGIPYKPLSQEPFFRFCGTRPPRQPLLIEASVVTIIARLYNKRYYDGSSILWPTELTGFKMQITTGFKMGFRGIAVKNDSVLAVSEGAKNYTYNLNERWTIANQNEIVPRVFVERAELATIPGEPNLCDNDRLVVSVMRLGESSGETKMDEYRFCGRQRPDAAHLFFASSNLPITVWFKSDDRHNAPGFRIQVNYTRIYAMPLSEGGFGRTEVQNDGVITSIRFPEFVTTIFASASATWVIASPRYPSFRLDLEMSSPSEPSKRIKLTYPDGTQETKTLGEKTFGATGLLLPNDTQVTWIVNQNELNRFAAKITFFNGTHITTTTRPITTTARLITTTRPMTEGHPSKSMSGGAIAGIVIALLLVVGLCAAGAAYYVFVLRKQSGDAPTVNYDRHREGGGHINITPASQSNPGFQPDP